MAAGSFQDRRIAGNEDLLMDLADLQRHVDFHHLVYQDADAAPYFSLKAVALDAHFVGAGIKPGHVVVAVFIRDGLARSARLDVLYLNAGSRHHGSGGIRHRANNVGSDALRFCETQRQN